MYLCLVTVRTAIVLFLSAPLTLEPRLWYVSPGMFVIVILSAVAGIGCFLAGGGLVSSVKAAP